MNYFLDNLKNRFDFFMRNHITFSRKNYTEGVNQENAVNFENIFENDEQKNLYLALIQKYDLNPFYNLNKVNFLTNLHYLAVFDKYISPPQKENVSVLDIGSKNWNYAGSEYAFFKKYAKSLTLTGIELDGYRLCTNLYNRYEIAKFYTKCLPNTNYIIGDFMEHNEKYDYIIWILPFITEYPHLKWGLPLKYFQPEKMLEHAHNLLNKNGEMLIINQGETEYKIQTELNKKLNLNYEPTGEIKSICSPFKNKRFCSKIIK